MIGGLSAGLGLLELQAGPFNLGLGIAPVGVGPVEAAAVGAEEQAFVGRGAAAFQPLQRMALGLQLGVGFGQADGGIVAIVARAVAAFRHTLRARGERGRRIGLGGEHADAHLPRGDLGVELGAVVCGVLFHQRTAIAVELLHRLEEAHGRGNGGLGTRKSRLGELHRTVIEPVVDDLH